MLLELTYKWKNIITAVCFYWAEVISVNRFTMKDEYVVASFKVVRTKDENIVGLLCTGHGD